MLSDSDIEEIITLLEALEKNRLQQQMENLQLQQVDDNEAQQHQKSSAQKDSNYSESQNLLFQCVTQQDQEEQSIVRQKRDLFRESIRKQELINQFQKKRQINPLQPEIKAGSSQITDLENKELEQKVVVEEDEKLENDERQKKELKKRKRSRK